MFCTNCGRQAADNAKFCTKCGMRFIVNVEPAKKKKTGLIVALSVIAVLVLVGGVLLFTFRDEVFGAKTPRPDRPVITATSSPEPATEPTDNQAEFDRFMDELFVEMVSEDSISLNFSVADPEAMGIERPIPTYGEVMTPEVFQSEREKTDELTETLDGFQYDGLRFDQQVAYDILRRNLELSRILEREDDFAYYSGYIRPLNGLQIQLPVLLAEFSFYTNKDIEDYLVLLADTIRYFDDIIEFESERAARGFFMSDANLDEVIEQLESFLENRDNNLLITVFNEKINAYPGLGEEQRAEYMVRNRKLVLENVLVAYDNLLEAMIGLRGVGANPAGLAALPNGAEYAHASLSLSAGVDRTAEQILSMVSRWREDTLTNAREMLNSSDALFDKYMNDRTGQIASGTPEEYLGFLEEAMLRDFPPINQTSYRVLEVHTSLREYVSPAFFLTPAVDSFDNNVIYINPADVMEDIDLFVTLAHEGYPGHMYQMVYFLQQSPHPLRMEISNIGYTEGWATYVEMLSYDYAQLDALEADFLREMSMYFLLLQSHADIGVNLFNWSYDDVADLLYADLGITDRETVDGFYDSVTGVPLNISYYTLGYIEMIALREHANFIQGEEFDLYEFHKFILDFGPAPFPIIRKNLG